MPENRSRQGIAEVTMQAYARRHGVEAVETPRCWPVRTRIILMAIICSAVGSLVIYWFVSSILATHRTEPRGTAESVPPETMPHLERLPRHVLPVEYTLRIIPVLEESNFTTIGDIKIHFYCKIPTANIRLHARGLDIKSLTVNEFPSINATRIISKYVQAGKDVVDIFLQQVLIPGESYTLRIKYVAPLYQNVYGLFRSEYVDRETNATRWIAVSNFSPDFARTAFPCFDEPWIKVPFRISIGRKADMRSHSNSMRKVVEEINGMPGYVWDHYEKTLPISSYLVAVMVTDFFGYAIEQPDRPYHTVYSREEVMERTEYVGHLATKVLRAIQKFTGFYYEPDKLDFIIVPRYAYSAMENWGLITFRESYSLTKKGIDTADHKRMISRIAAHEVAHQWFGNLVTPKWWSDVWLKESFSSFFGNWALNEIEPLWSRSDAYAEEYNIMFENDAEDEARPLHVNLSTVKLLHDIFDTSMYIKGNCVVNMIFHFLGESAFLSSVHRYIRTYYYSSADQEDTWNIFQEEIAGKKSLPAGLTMNDIMRTWTNQAGYPLLQVKRDRSGVVQLTQDRFYNYGSKSPGSELWYIPLTWATEGDRQFSNTTPRAWMLEKRMEISEAALSESIYNNRWFLFNINRTGLYRVNYDAENWVLLTNAWGTLSRLTKVQLLSDAFAISGAGLLNDTIAWNIFRKLMDESEEMLWTTTMGALRNLKNRLWNSHTFKYAICKTVDKVYSVEAKNLPHIDPNVWTRFKVDVMKWACSVGHKTCLITVRGLVVKMLRNEGTSSFPEDFRKWLYCMFVKDATAEQWTNLFQQFKNFQPKDKSNLAYGLGCHNETTYLRRYLSSFLWSHENSTLDENYVIALTSVAKNPYGNTIATEFLTEYIENSGNVNTTVVVKILSALPAHADQEEILELLKRLKTSNAGYDGVISRAIEKIQSNIEWATLRKNEILRSIDDIAVELEETEDCTRSGSASMY